MESIKEIQDSVLPGGHSVRQLLKLAERMAARAPKTDERCPDCRDTGWIHVEPDDPQRGVRRCRRPECVAKRRAVIEARREARQQEGDEDI
ncbi:MAG: hypothetical protein HY231_24135 [Acidobacteria bacterium]|nr:hypothetical protein [Acidobacteriota bacterium]